MPDYALQAELVPAHQQDVKDVLALSNDRIASCSRDGSVAIWDKAEPPTSFHLKALLNGHHAYVNSLAHIPDSSRGDVLASGGNSSLILLHSLTTLDPEPVQCLIGHALNVCVLSYATKSRELISGSWDKTARVWVEENGEWRTKLVLDEHAQAVWGVVGIDEGEHAGGYLTGSADQLVILWNGQGEAVSRFKGYPEPVRSLVVLPEPDLFASACNDGLVRISDMSGKIVSVLEGHKDSVFQVTNGLNGAVVSCGEDHTARLWSGELTAGDQRLTSDQGEEAAVLKHPCQTVWAVSVLPNGDVVTAGSDGRVRVWTADVARYADENTRTTYGREVDEAMRVTAAAQAPKAAPDEARDIVIDIDVSDDAEPLKLHFRTDGDSRAAAQDFVKQHDLPTSYIDTIDEFIQAHI